MGGRERFQSSTAVLEVGSFFLGILVLLDWAFDGDLLSIAVARQ